MSRLAARQGLINSKTILSPEFRLPWPGLRREWCMREWTSCCRKCRLRRHSNPWPDDCRPVPSPWSQPHWLKKVFDIVWENKWWYYIPGQANRAVYFTRRIAALIIKLLWSFMKSCQLICDEPKVKHFVHRLKNALKRATNDFLVAEQAWCHRCTLCNRFTS